MRRRVRCSKDGCTNGGASGGGGEKSGYKQKYDMVLCDAPCSGDGTARKSGQAWSAWSISHAMSLHRLQRRILRRGMELLRPGGVLVYSTCSLNPLEDEAVVASVIGDVGGPSAMEIAPLPDWLLRKCGGGALRGLSAWRVPNPKFGKGGANEMYGTFGDVPVEHRGGKGEEGKKKGGQINRSMFPPECDSELSAQLVNCGRFVPSDELDSGGFFVACIRRLQVGELAGVEKEKATKQESSPGEESERVAEDAKRKADDAGNAGDAAVGIAPDDNRTATSSTDQEVASSLDNGNEQCLREGDWICASCKEVNFGRRGSMRCFKCKARQLNSKREKEDKVQRPLLAKPASSILQQFLDFFGVEAGPGSNFPLSSVHLISRAKERVLVVVSDSLSRLAISANWSPV